MNWINLTPELTREGQTKLQVGQVLIFDFEGSPVHLKVMRKFKGKVWVKQTYLPLPDEVEVKDV